DYSVPLHVGALFVLLIASALGCAIPHAANVIYKMRGRKELRFILKHFGSGILLSTAFIHLLFHSFVWFSNSCVGELKYEAASAAIAMAAVYVCFLLDFIALRSVRQRVMQARQTLLARSGPQGGAGTGSEDDEKLGHREEALSRDDASEQLDREEFRLNKWSIVSLEAGIVFHSIIIGVTLGASSGEGWVPLLIAITFHQFCEALGLASRIAFVLERAHAEVSHRMLKIVLHSVFILSTSFGIAIGIGVRKSFNGNDRDTLLTIGVLDSVSAGILLYSSLTQILPKDWLESREMLTCGWGRIAAGLGSFTAGLFIMVSLRGAWRET
ncbi:Zinc/iron permease, partial [Jaminaea rosea]